jgi:hypothetical protein
MSRSLIFIVIVIVIVILFLYSCHAKDKSTIVSPISTPTFADSVARVTTASAFVNRYVDNCNKIKDAVDVVQWVDASPPVMKHLKTELKRLNDEA